MTPVVFAARWSVFVILLAGAALAKPPAGGVFCAKYPTSPECIGKQPSCAYCHVAPPQRNVFGTSLEADLAPGAARPLSDGDFSMALPGALTAAEAGDADGDGVTNLVEIQQGTQPADPTSKPVDRACQGTDNPQYSVCRYDLRYVYKKVLLDFCGASPTFSQVKDFQARADHANRKAFIAAEVDRCTQTEFWRGKNGQLWKVAHPKIRPVGSLKKGEDPGGIPLADYYDDYALFAYTQTDDHDAREILTADFFVRRTTNPTRYTKVQDLPGSQKVDRAHRAGNMTTAWALTYFVMFTALPRNAASQMYRGYLGLDIAKQEGLFSVANEPQDYDAKGVQARECAACHATLDPLTYPFRNYNGISSPMYETQYVPNRLELGFNTTPRITQTPERGVIFGQPVNNLREWATVATDSDAFAISTATDYWKLLVGHPPKPDENTEFVATWKRFRGEHQYRVQKLLQDIVKTEAYGAP